MYLIPGMSILKIDDSTLQFGSDAHAIRVYGLTVGMIETVLAASRQRGKFARYLARKNKVPIAEYERTLRILEEKHLVLSKLPETDLESCFYRLYGDSPLVDRDKQALEITGLPLFSYYLVEALQEYQFRHFRFNDKSLISNHDMGYYPPLSVGQLRENIFPKLLQGPLKSVGSKQKQRLSIGVFNYQRDLVWQARQQRRNISQLPIVIEENQIQIGPLFEPNITLCPRCVYLSEKNRGDVLSLYDDCSIPKSTFPATPLLRMVAYFSAEQISNYFAGIPHLLRNKSAVFSFGLGIPTFTSWQAHPDCECRLGSHSRTTVKKAVSKNTLTEKDLQVA